MSPCRRFKSRPQKKNSEYKWLHIVKRQKRRHQRQQQSHFNEMCVAFQSMEMSETARPLPGGQIDGPKSFGCAFLKEKIDSLMTQLIVGITKIEERANGLPDPHAAHLYGIIKEQLERTVRQIEKDCL
ncbi:hypothetical protein niasHT_034406 [Heterodera trifolii]|uniref:Uncharacterized protein n=1 Tax=Heterodera trifolii TaxID=157864 RepID=A0ABD2HVZ3_9BILA